MMGNDIVLSTARELGYTDARLALIRNTVAQGADDFELAQFLIVAKETGLDPMRKQIYLIKRWNSELQKKVATPQTGIDGYRAIADRTGRYAPGQEPTFIYDDSGNLIKATAYVKKLAGGVWHEVAASAIWSEYVQTKQDKKTPTAFWQNMPHVMLAKVAETLALRRAFPGELSGVYTHEEMMQADHPDTVDAQYVEVAPAQIAAPQEPIAVLATDEQKSAVDDLGKRYYRQTWNTAIAEFLLFITDGGTGSLDELTEQEAQKAVDYLWQELAKRKQPAAAQPDAQPA